jgi:hypothetical protein
MLHASSVSQLSTENVAREVGINRVTLERWLSNGKVAPPKKIQIGRSEFRNWTDADVERVRKYKQDNYGKGKGKRQAESRSPNGRKKQDAPVQLALTRP